MVGRQVILQTIPTGRILTGIAQMASLSSAEKEKGLPKISFSSTLRT